MGVFDRIFGNKKKDLSKVITEFMMATSASDARRILEEHPELISTEADSFLNALSKDTQSQKIRDLIQNRRYFLALCREVGISRAFEESSDSSGETYRDNLQMILKEIYNLSSPQDIPRKILMLQHALSLVHRESNSKLWDFLQVELGNCLVQNPQGDRGSNIEQAIEHCNKSLKVYTQKGFPIQWAITQNTLAIAYNDRTRGDRAENIEKAIEHCDKALEVRMLKDYPALWAAIHSNLGNAYGNRIRGNGAENIERAIEHYNQALEVYRQKDFPVDWAATQHNLAIAYRNRIWGNSAENIEKAIEYYYQALSVYTREDFPVQWAMTQNNLANAYRIRIRGDRAENIEKAIKHCNQALEVRTQKNFPEDWAMTQNTLAIAYSYRIRGNRAENIEKALECYKQALTIRTQKNLPEDWAATQNNLASAYNNRIRGDRAENIEKAIEHYNQTLQVYTYQDFPINWAGTQNNLAIAYYDRIRGNKAENIEKALQHCNQALEVRTQKDFPEDWAITQNNLAIAYYNRIRGDRAENIEKAIEHYNQALKVRTQKDYPVDWAMTQNNLANAYWSRIRGDRAENIEKAIEHYNQALEIYMHEDFPVDWAKTQNNLANAYCERIRGDKAENIEKAIEYYNQALKVRTQKDFPEDWATTQHNLALAYYYRIKGDKAENIEKAIEYYNQALKVRTQKDFPVDWAETHNNLALAYYYRIWGDRVDNIEKAIENCNQALEVRTQKDFPIDWAAAQHNLALAYKDRILGDKSVNIEKAVNHFHGALKIYKLESMPNDFRIISRHLGDLCFDIGKWENAVEIYNDSIKAGKLLYRSGLSLESKNVEARYDSFTYRKAALAACRLGFATEALLILEEGKTRLLSETLRLKMEQPEGVPKEEWQKYKDAAEKYRTVIKRFDQEDYVQREMRAQEALNELENSVKIVQMYTPKFQKDLDISDILSVLDEDTALLTFCITDKGSIGFIVSKSGGVQSVDIPDFKKDDVDNLLSKPNEQGYIASGWIGDYLNYLNAPDIKRYDALQTWQKTLDKVLSCIGAKLLCPLLAELPSQTKKLILTPSGGLFLLPLHAIPLSNDQLLCQRYCTSYAPSIQLLKDMKNKARALEKKGLYVVINPQEDPRLVFSGCEGQAISKLFESRQVNVGKTGTKPTVLDGVPSWSYIHFSCHGRYNWDNPRQSGLCLAGDGIMSLADLQNDIVDISSARLVTLSACETGITDIMRGSADEFVGLPAGFMLAGVPCVVSSLWSVPDISTGMLMERFYSNHIIKGMDIPMALQDAQLWVRDLSSIQVADYVEKCYLSGKWEGKSKEFIEQYRAQYLDMAKESPDEKPFHHPYYWAAFTVNGA